eukprot:1481267-Pyramimonas_sp.AAC.1
MTTPDWCAEKKRRLVPEVQECRSTEVQKYWGFKKSQTIPPVRVQNKEPTKGNKSGYEMA